MFNHIWDNDPNEYFSEGFKPPTGKQSGTPAKSSVAIMSHRIALRMTAVYT